MRTHRVLAAGMAAGLCLFAGVACQSDDAPSGYSVRNLVSDLPVAAKYGGGGGGSSGPTIDANLKNPWGIVFNPQGFVWVANNHTDTSTLYDGNGVKQNLVVTLPAGTDPTGIVFNGTADFGDADFIFDGEGGTIAAWPGGTSAVTKFTAADDAIYKGLAIAANGAANCLYAADFHNNKLDVFDKNFAKVTAGGGGCPPGSAFADATIPAGFAPYGIQNIGGLLYVTYAKQDAAAQDEVAGAGLGYVNRFNSDGGGRVRFAAQGNLNAPWGVARAPPNFGIYSGDILIGNFGDGAINAYDPNNGQFIGSLADGNGNTIRIEGLWGIAYGNGINSQPANTLFFAAGINDEVNGLYGRIDCGC